MPTTKQPHLLSELAGLGADIFNRHVCPTLRPEDHGKFVAIDVETEDFEVNDDDYAALANLRSRRPDAEIWLMRAGYPAAYRMGVAR